jgi:hypothetical protein
VGYWTGGKASKITASLDPDYSAARISLLFVGAEALGGGAIFLRLR